MKINSLNISIPHNGFPEASVNIFLGDNILLLYLCTGKRKFDGGNQNQGDPKRRYQSNWNQSSGPAGGVNGGAADAQWYQDSYNSTWQ